MQPKRLPRDAGQDRQRCRILALEQSLSELQAAYQAEVARGKELESQLATANERLERKGRQVRKLAGELTIAEYRERKRLSLQLHDHLQQILVAAKLQVSCLEGMAHGALKASAGRVAQLLSGSLELSRKLTAELCPPLIFSEGIQGGAEWLVHWMRDQHQIEVILTTESPLPPQTDAVQIVFFESIRELLFNAAKHAGISRIHLRLEQTPDAEVKITVEDEGIGFNTDRTHETQGSRGGSGLLRVAERIETIGGHFRFESTIGQGSRFTIIGPRHGQFEAPSHRDRKKSIRQ